MASSSFQRSPSKVWWAHGLEEPHAEWQNRSNGSGSPSSHKSQDSGFSDSEISPSLGCIEKPRHNEDNLVNENKPNGTPKRIFSASKLSSKLFKNKSSTENTTPKNNLTENIKEKYSPKKSVTTYLTDECLKKTEPKLYERHNPFCRSLPNTPANHTRNKLYLSKSTSQAPSPLPSPLLYQCRRLTLFKPAQHPPIEASNEYVYYQSSKVNRNLFPVDSNDSGSIEQNFDLAPNSNHPQSPQNTETTKQLHSITLPIPKPVQPSMKSKLNETVPLYYQYNLDKIESDFENNSSSHSDSDISLNASSSNDAISCDSFSYKHEEDEEEFDSEKEVESFFYEKIESPAHTSTPKNQFKKMGISSMRKRIINKKKNSYLFETVERLTETNPVYLPQIPSVKCWLNEVEKLYEPECMTTLQSKSIALDLARHVQNVADATTATIRELLKHSRIIGNEFNNIKMKVQMKQKEHLGPLTQSLVGNVTEFVLKNMVNSQSSSLVDVNATKNDIQKLLDLCGQLRQSTATPNPNMEEISSLLLNLQITFCCTENNILAMQIQLLVNAVEDSSSHLALRGVLSGLTSLASQCERLSNLIVETGGPRALLILCVDCKASTIRTMALRTLATVCCSTTAIRQLEQADGIEILADILSDTSRPEPELSEATAVLAQITAPWIEDNHSVQGLGENVATLITAITDFLVKTKCCQNLLLCAAALANITYMNVDAIGALIQNQTIGKLLNAVRNRGPKASVFLKEQTATLIANISDIVESRNYLADNNAGVALLCFLQIYPINSQEEIQRNAAQRLQQKSAIALSRLCSDPCVAQQIVDLSGVSRLVQLCKEGKERNHSDAVLVACLATLRKIVANCGHDVMDQRDIMELVEPRLLDSFLAYSSQNESYV